MGGQENSITEKRKKRFIPSYAYSSAIICCSICSALYFVTKYMGIGEPHNIESSLDKMIPFVPFWSSIYLLCYLFWAFNAILTAREGKETWFKFVAAYVLAELFCNIVYIVYPTTMPRPEVTGGGIFNWLMIIIYSADLPYNLLPSLHCMLSWLVTRYLIGSKKVPKWYQAASVINCLLIFLSTLFTRQHVIIDIITGVLVAEAAAFTAERTGLHLKFRAVFEKLDDKLIKKFCSNKSHSINSRSDEGEKRENEQ